MSENGSEPIASEVPEQKPVEKKSECYIVPERAKPLVECCKDFEEGRIDESTFFAEALVRTGEFMKSVKAKTVSTNP